MTCHATTHKLIQLKQYRDDKGWLRNAHIILLVAFIYINIYIFPHIWASHCLSHDSHHEWQRRKKNITISLRFNLHLIREIFAWHKIIRWERCCNFLFYLRRSFAFFAMERTWIAIVEKWQCVFELLSQRVLWVEFFKRKKNSNVDE